jgi:hypothetical protein
MTTELLPILVSVLALISVWAVFFFSTMYIVKSIFEKIDEYKKESKDKRNG